jgi:uncharacterized protein (DUF433 family)
LTLTEVHDLVRFYEAGHSTLQSATEFGINRETVLEHLKRAAAARRPNARKMNDEQVTQAAELYAANARLATVAKHFDVNAATIRSEFNQAGLPTRRRRGWTDG